MKKILFITLMAACLAAGCALLQQIEQRVAIKNCTFKLTNAQARNFTLTDMSVDLNIAVQNPNTVTVTIDKLDLILLVNDRQTVKAFFSGQSIDPQQTKALTTTVVIPYTTVGMAIIDMLRKNEPVRYRLDGEIYLNTPIGMINFPVTIYESK